MIAEEYKEIFHNLSLSNKRELATFMDYKDLKGIHSMFNRPNLTDLNYKKFMYFLDVKLFSRVKEYVDSNDYYGELTEEKIRLHNYILTDDFKRLNLLSQTKLKYYLRSL